MNNFNVVEALSQIAREKNVDREMVVQTLADALISAAKRRYGDTENYAAEIDPTSGQMEVVARKIVVEEVNEPSAEISLDDARALESEAQLGSEIVEHLDFADFGRNAIQTAKQILIQRVREAERDDLFQSIVLKIHEAAARYQPARPLAPWLFTIAANTVRNHFRDSPDASLVSAVDDLAEAPDPVPGPERVLEARETVVWELLAAPA